MKKHRCDDCGREFATELDWGIHRAKDSCGPNYTIPPPQEPTRDVEKLNGEILENYSHPCRATCSGWKQGYEQGEIAERANQIKLAEEYRLRGERIAELEALYNSLRKPAEEMLAPLRAQLAAARSALEKIKPLAKYYFEPRKAHETDQRPLPLAYPNEDCAEEIYDICESALSAPGDAGEGKLEANQAAVGSKANFTFLVDPGIPEDEVHLRLDGKTVGKIINVPAQRPGGENG